MVMREKDTRFPLVFLPVRLLDAVFFDDERGDRGLGSKNGTTTFRDVEVPFRLDFVFFFLFEDDDVDDEDDGADSLMLLLLEPLSCSSSIEAFMLRRTLLVRLLLLASFLILCRGGSNERLRRRLLLPLLLPSESNERPILLRRPLLPLLLPSSLRLFRGPRAKSILLRSLLLPLLLPSLFRRCCGGNRCRRFLVVFRGPLFGATNGSSEDDPSSVRSVEDKSSEIFKLSAIEFRMFALRSSRSFFLCILDRFFSSINSFVLLIFKKETLFSKTFMMKFNKL